MFDTMTFTKVLGGFCGALLIFLLGNWAAESLYHTGGGEHGGHGEEHAQGYMIETGDSGAAPAEEEAVDVAALVAEADVAKGKKVFSKCEACHHLEKGANGTGPYLFGVVGRDIGSAEGFGYSSALSGLDGVWDYDHLYAFLQSPKTYAPGTKMGFAGLKKSKDRANIIAYLETIK